MAVWCIRYCKTCGAGPREQVECEQPDCEIETLHEALMREHVPVQRDTSGAPAAQDLKGKE